MEPQVLVFVPDLVLVGLDLSLFGLDLALFGLYLALFGLDLELAQVLVFVGLVLAQLDFVVCSVPVRLAHAELVEAVDLQGLVLVYQYYYLMYSAPMTQKFECAGEVSPPRFLCFLHVTANVKQI